jgi:hypothetical protein
MKASAFALPISHLEDNSMAEPRDTWSKAQIIASILTPILLFIFGFTISTRQKKLEDAQSQYQKDTDNVRQKAEDDQKSIDRVVGSVKDLNSDKPTEQLVAIQLLSIELDKAKKDFHLELLASALPTLVKLSTCNRDPKDPVQLQASTLLNAVSAGTTFSIPKDIKCSEDPTVASIFIQIQDSDQSAPAKLIQASFATDKTVKVEGIELVKNAGPASTEVRYFRLVKTEGDGTLATRVAETLKSLGVSDAHAVPVNLSAPKFNSIRPKQLEIWFGRGPLNVKGV